MQILPDELNFEDMKRMYPSKKSQLRKQALGSAPYSNAGTGIELLIPKMANTFADMGTMNLRFDANFTLGGGTEASTTTWALLGSAYSFFSNQVVTAGGTTIESLFNPSLLFNTITNMTMDPSQREALSASFGFNPDNGTTNYGVDINQASYAGSGLSQSFCIPLISVLNTSKLLPLFVTDFRITLTLNDVKNQ